MKDGKEGTLHVIGKHKRQLVGRMDEKRSGCEEKVSGTFDFEKPCHRKGLIGWK